jgi:hypothetical protein
MGDRPVLTALPQNYTGVGNHLLGSCAVYFWLEPTFRRKVSPPSSGQLNRDENIVSRCLQMVRSKERSTYIVSWQVGAGE